jgi:hypothetical protein
LGLGVYNFTNTSNPNPNPNLMLFFPPPHRPNTRFERRIPYYTEELGLGLELVLKGLGKGLGGFD